ncbi:MAG TPA: hypothetical protein VFA52_04245 [Candidatus Paceibacterota bacterium]|jgi:hypothetical protein|nr:hypothetical protein [Candidatus Paceibacterota bacterium]
MQAKPAVEVIREAYSNPANPQNLRLAHNGKQNAIAAWDAELNRFVMVASATIDGKWVTVPYELLVNGERVVSEWFEVERQDEAR